MIDIAIPKGSLQNQTLQLFEQAGLEVKRTEREYNARIEDPRIGKVKILRPQEIPEYVAKGYFDLGISGTDWIMESGAVVARVGELNYGKQGPGIVKLVVAVPESLDIHSAREIKPGSRVSTEYPSLTRAFFRNLGIPVDVEYSFGATEAKVPELTDVVVDLTETGSTLVKNNLKIIDVMLKSTSELIANKKSWADPEKHEEIIAVQTLLSAVIKARGKGPAQDECARRCHQGCYLHAAQHEESHHLQALQLRLLRSGDCGGQIHCQPAHSPVEEIGGRGYPGAGHLQDRALNSSFFKVNRRQKIGFQKSKRARGDSNPRSTA